MPKVAKIVLSVIVAGIIWPAKLSVAQAISITKGSHESDSPESVSSSTGVEHYRTRIIGLDNGPEGLPRTKELTHCDLDPQGCGAITASTTRTAAGSMTANDARSSKGRTAGGVTEFSEPTALLLLIVGLIGLSRLRGKPMD